MRRVRLDVRPFVLLLVLGLTGCVSVAPAETADPSASAASLASAAPEPTASPTPSPTPLPTRPVVWPLRGTIAANAQAIRTRPVLVRIPNDVSARPQSGLANADMVWELLTEGGITRYMAVYQSEEAEQVGPIRSARLSDLHYAPMLRGILAHVGASAIVLQRVRAAAAAGTFIDVDQFRYGSYYDRVPFRSPPQNVYTSTTRLRQAATAAGDTGGVDVPSLEFVVCGAPCPSPVTATTFTVPYLGAMRVTYTYDASARGFTRVQGGTKTIDAATGKPVVATNVVVIWTDVTPQPGVVEDANGALSLEIRSTGTGRAAVFVEGRRYDGTWSREGDGAYRFRAPDGPAIGLEPGQTWVHVIPNDWRLESAP